MPNFMFDQLPLASHPGSLPPFNRLRLVRLCAYFSGDAQAAEDLAQETLLEAWRNAHKLYDPSGYETWLANIARNVCLRWARQRGRESSQLDWPDSDLEADWPARAVDLEVELEQGDLATLLDRALTLLPAETRAVLIERYIHEASLADVAARLGLSEGNIAVRLHRGKLTLRRILNTELRRDAIDFGLVNQTASLQPTRLWCIVCGQQRLEGRLDSTAGDLFLRCPGCYRRQGMTIRNMRGLPKVLKGAKGFRVALTRAIQWSESQIAPALRTGRTTCPFCGRTLQPKLITTPGGYQWDASCSACPSVNTHNLNVRLLASPVGLAFWKRHPRLRRLPATKIETQGLPALVVGWESVTNNARLELLVARDTFTILNICQLG